MMDQKGMKGILILGCGLLLCVLPACTTMKNVVGFFKFWDNRKESVAEESYKNFAGKMKPVLRGNPESHYNLGRYYQERGKHREAVVEFRKTVAIDPGNVRAHSALGVSYDILGMYARASECYQAAIRIDPSAAYVYNNMGQSLMLQGNYVPAIEAFRKAVAIDGGNLRIHNNLAKAYALAGRQELAIKEFEIGAPKVSGEMMVEQVLKEAARPAIVEEPIKASPAAVPVKVADDDGAADFVTRVSGFLDERLSPKSADQPKKQVEIVTPVETKIPTNVLIEVSNGNGVNRMATSIGGYLKKKGFRVARITNASRFDVARTCIYYEKQYAETATELVKYMQEIKNGDLKEVRRLDVPQIKIKLLVGKDLIPHQKSYTDAKS